MKENEQHIIAAILAGKTDRFSYFLEQYGQQVFHLIVRMVTSQEDAEELTQDCFMKAFNHLSSFNGNSSFSTWLYRIAYNTALSFLRKETARQEIRITEQLWNTLSDEEVDQTLNTEDTVLIEKLQQLIKQLSPEEQAILTFYYLLRRGKDNSRNRIYSSPQRSKYESKIASNPKKTFYLNETINYKV